MEKLIKGNICCPVSKRIFYGELHIENGIIKEIIELSSPIDTFFILPGLVDAHIHIESSLLIPSEFARAAVKHGTTATVSDPHEIANVMGLPGIEFMIENGKKTPFKFNFGASSCVPATNFETAGATITIEDIDKLLQRDDIKYLSEMMNYPGVLFEFPEVIEKLKIAQKHGKPIDGHSPGLRGKDAEKYISMGISTDHECFKLDEALEKISYGMKIIIREGTAAKNFEELHPILSSHPDMCMFCSDDKHPDDLLIGHINKIMARAIEKGHNFFNVLRATTYNPIKHYNLNSGLLQIGDPADLILVKDIKNFDVISTIIDGKYAYNDGKVLIDTVHIVPINHFNCSKKKPEDFKIYSKQNKVTVNVIEAVEGQLITNKLITDLDVKNGEIIPDIENDILKITVVNRYKDNPPAVAFIKNFGLKQGAIASSVGHDSHNIIAVGTNDEDLCNAVNLVIENKGGLSLANKDEKDILPLPIAGLMSTDDVANVGKKYSNLYQRARQLGSNLHSVYMTASFMALLVIPSIKLSDLGLFNGEKFEFMNLINS